MKTRRRKLITRILQRLLSPGRGEVRAMEQALQIEGILRFVGLFALMVLVPAILLAWYGLGSIRVEEFGLDQEVSLDAADRSERQANIKVNKASTCNSVCWYRCVQFNRLSHGCLHAAKV